MKSEKPIRSKAQLEALVVEALRATKGCAGVSGAVIAKLEERNFIGANWQVFALEPPILDSVASFRAFQICGGLAYQFDLQD